MEKMRTFSEDVRFVVALEPETLTQVNAADTPLQVCETGALRSVEIRELHATSPKMPSKMLAAWPIDTIARAQAPMPTVRLRIRMPTDG
jgi:hypothetical protein